MNKMMRLTLGVACVAFATSCVSTNPDHAAVERAVLDYVEACEQARPELIERSVRPDLHKLGFRRLESGEFKSSPMTFERLVELSGELLPGGHVPDDATHSVEVFDVLDKTATAKLTAFWGIDFMHLVKEEGHWKIVQVLWQSAP